MPIRKATAQWKGDLKSGKGHMKGESGALDAPFSFTTRFQDEPGTNPDELIGAALAGCFSMAFSADISEAGYDPKSVETSADVTIEEVDGDFRITTISLDMEAEIPGIDEETFQETAEAAKNGCPVSNALTGTDIKLNATLK